MKANQLNGKMFIIASLMLGAIITAHVVQEQRITCVYNREVYPMPDSLAEKAKLIIYVDSIECSKCRISRFVQYSDYYRLSDEIQSFVPFLLLSLKEGESLSIQEHLLDIELPFPVFLDDNNMFMKLNPSIPKDIILHAFLTDATGAVLVAGDPAANEHLRRLYYREINEKL